MSEGKPEAQRALVRVGLIGLGRWGRILADRVARTERFGVVALCDRRPERLRAAGAAHPDARPHAEVDALLQEVDAVVIAAGGAEHAGLARRALVAGKHVLVEKPVALSGAEAEELRGLAETRGLQLMGGHLLRYAPVLAAVEAMVREGALGELLHVATERSATTAAPESDAWWALGPHDVSLTLALVAAEPSSIRVEPLRLGAEAAVRFADGVSARIRVEAGDLPRKRRLTVRGTAGVAIVEEGPNGLEAVVRVDGGTRRLRTEGPDPLERELLAFAAAILDGVEPRTGAAEAVRVVRVLEAGARSLREGGVAVRLSPREVDASIRGVPPGPPSAAAATPPG